MRLRTGSAAVLTLMALALPATSAAAPKGQLDTGYGFSGTALLTDLPDGYVRGGGHAVDSQGRVVAAAGNSNELSDVIVDRLRPNGLVDPDFGQGGRATIDVGEGETEVLGIATGPDDKTVVAGRIYVYDELRYRSFFLRLTVAGAPDPAFGGADATPGVVFVDDVLPDLTDGFRDISDMAVDAAGRVVWTGQTLSELLLARLTAAGALDPSFGGGDGNMTLSTGSSDSGIALSFGPGNTVTVVGNRKTGLFDTVYVARFTQSGIDPSFNGTGVRDVLDNEVSGGVVGQVGVDGSGGVLANASVFGEGGYFRTETWRYTVAGAPDVTFGEGGVMENLSLGFPWSPILFYPDHGFVSGTKAYEPDGSPDPGFGTNGTYTPAPNLPGVAFTFDRVDNVAFGPDGSPYVMGTATPTEPSEDQGNFVHKLGPDHLPTAAFNPPVTALLGQPTQLDAGNSTDQDGPLTFAWDFDSNGTTDAQGSSVSQVFGQLETATVTLRVTDAVGHVASVTHSFPVRRPSVIVHTTGIGEVTTNSAVVNGTLNDRGFPTTYWLEYGKTPSYGSRTPDRNTISEDREWPTSVTVAGLEPGTQYHARLVAQGEDGPIFGEDRAFTTASGPAAGLPPLGVHFNIVPDSNVFIAGQAVRFSTFEVPQGTQFEWRFDNRGRDRDRLVSFERDPTVSFDAAADHDADRFVGSTGQRRRTYYVLLRLTAPNGAVGEYERFITVLPNTAPKADFDVQREIRNDRETTAVDSWVTFRGQAEDPDQIAGREDRVRSYLWRLDAWGGGHDVRCDVGAPCVDVQTGHPPDPHWFQGSESTIRVNFFKRALIKTGVCPLTDRPFQVDQHYFDAPANGWTQCAALPIPGGPPYWMLSLQTGDHAYGITREPFAAMLYDHSRLVSSGPFNQPTGPAIGEHVEPVSVGPLFDADQRVPRSVGLTVTDSIGASYSVRHPVPLTRDAAPELNARFGPAGQPASPASGELEYPIVADRDYQFDVTGASDAEFGRPLLYSLEFGSTGGCGPAVTGGQRRQAAKASLMSDATRPFALRTTADNSIDAIYDCKRFMERNVVSSSVFTKSGLMPPIGRSITFRFPEPNQDGDPQTLVLSAYDRAGLASIQKIEGFRVFRGGSGTCRQINGVSTRIGGREVGLGLSCAEDLGNRQRFWATGGLSVNGVKLRPPKGAAIYVDVSNRDKPVVIATRAGRGDAGSVSKMRAARTSVDLLADDAAIATIDGFDQSRLTAMVLGRENTLDPRELGKPIDYPPSRGAAYRGLDLTAERIVVDFNSQFQATMNFAVVMPAGFGKPGSRATEPVVLKTQETAIKSILQSKTFAEAASAKGKKGRSTRATARAAQALPSIPDSAKIILDRTQLGPLYINSGFLEVNTAKGSWEGNISDATLSVGTQKPKVKFRILIVKGELKEVSGGFSDARITLFPGLDLTGGRFSLVTDPNLEINAGVSLQALGFVDGDLDLKLRPDPFFLRLDGVVSVYKIKVAEGFVQYDDAAARADFGFRYANNFGPASVDIGVKGAIQNGDFYVAGEGRLCIAMCFTVKGVASSVALAACGEFKLLFATVAAGLAYRFKGGFEVFAGCDLQRYIPAGLRSSSFRAASDPTTVSLKDGLDSVAFKIKGDPAAQIAPRVTILEPGGRTITMGDHQGDFTFGAPMAVSPAAPAGTNTDLSTLVDQDPVSGITSVVIAKPKPGAWQVKLDGGQAPLLAIEVAEGRHIDIDAFGAKTVIPSSAKDGVFGRTEIRAAGATTAAATKKPKPKQEGQEVRARAEPRGPQEPRRAREAARAWRGHRRPGRGGRRHDRHHREGLLGRPGGGPHRHLEGEGSASGGLRPHLGSGHPRAARHGSFQRRDSARRGSRRPLPRTRGAPAGQAAC